VYEVQKVMQENDLGMRRWASKDMGCSWSIALSSSGLERTVASTFSLASISLSQPPSRGNSVVEVAPGCWPSYSSRSVYTYSAGRKISLQVQ